VEVVGDAMLVQPGTRVLHRLAVLDAVDGDGQGPRSYSIVNERLLFDSV